MRLWLLFAVLIFLGSCVSNKKVVLLQNRDVNTKGLPKDSIVRTYAIDTFNYKIQPNDILSVRFQSLTPEEFDFFAPENLQQVGLNLAQGGYVMGELVDEEGQIPFPVLGKVKVEGLTVFEIQDMLQSIADDYLESPIVKVRLLNFRVTVLGEVAKEGTVTLLNNRVSMLEALGMAGGLGELADRGNIKLIRQKGGQTEIQYLNLLDENFFNSPYYYVYQNDVLIVPPLPQRPFRRYFGTNLSLVVSTISLLLLAINLTR
ncbi:MAG: polysaccharide biosynthesis/export family protein [Cyclobacteriaceae bacterium]